jgi:DHA3 family macrolide efflux protein-like MFS transporter
MTPAAYLIAGPLADSVFEPMVGKAGWEWVAPLVGDAAGSGMGLIFVLSGTIALMMSIVLFSVPMIRNIESLLPDYKAQPAEEELVPEIAHA